MVRSMILPGKQHVATNVRKSVALIRRSVVYLSLYEKRPIRLGIPFKACSCPTLTLTTARKLLNFIKERAVVAH